MKIGVFGTGTMGSGIAQQFAVSGHDVVLVDVNMAFAESAVAKIDKGLQRQVDKERMSADDKSSTMARIKPSVQKDDVKDCNLVIEAIPEVMAMKRELFAELDKICSENTIFATNTSSLSITEMAASTARPDKFIGMHFFNPVPVMKLVEVICGIATSKETEEKIFNLAGEIGKTAVNVAEAPGFIVNRILIPMINEGVGILADGVASAEDIDNAMKLGANHPIGPLALADLIGLDVCLNIMDVLYDEFKDDKYRAHPLMRKMVRGKLLGRKTKQGFFAY